jgi:hypothetical protein
MLLLPYNQLAYEHGLIFALIQMVQPQLISSEHWCKTLPTRSVNMACSVEGPTAAASALKSFSTRGSKICEYFIGAMKKTGGRVLGAATPVYHMSMRGSETGV